MKKYFYFFLYFILIIYLIENILAIKNQTKIDFRQERSIILSEHIPLMSMTILPGNYEMGTSDSLARKRFKLRTDKQGYIMPSKIHNNPDITMVFIGGSTIECLYVEEKNRFPYLAGRILEKEIGKKINSYNSGVAGNDTRDSLNILLNKIILLRPNIVIMMHNINDITNLLDKGAYWDEDYLVRDNFYTISKKIISISVPNLYIHLRNILVITILPKFSDKLASSKMDKSIIDGNKLTDKFKKNLQVFINICKARGIIPVLMTQANRLKDNPDKVVRDSMQEFEINQAINYNEFKKLYDLFNEIIREIGRDNDILIIDLAKEIPQEKEYMFDAVHFNDNGSKFAAKIISGEIKKLFSYKKENWSLLPKYKKARK